MTSYQLSFNNYRQIRTNKYSILINKKSLIKSLNNGKYELYINHTVKKERLNANFVHILKLLRKIC